MQLFVQQLVNGLSLGAVYALIALGYTMIYGVLRLINFAHGDVYMVGAVIAYALTTFLVAHGVAVWIILPTIFVGSMAGCAVLGFLIERICYRPLRNQPRLVALITAIGVSLLLENLFQNSLVFGATPRHMPTLIAVKTAVSIRLPSWPAPVTLTNIDLISFGLTITLMAALTAFVLKTRAGLALRAVSYRFDTAWLMGVNTDRMISFTFMLGSALAAVAGVMDAMRYDVEPLMGLQQGLKAFVAAVLGGIGSIPGAVVGGLVMGIVEALLRGMILPSAYTGYSDGASFLILILVLLVRPSGLFGRHTPEKV
jgi:branched-chain amino acid transport system permease protein